MCTVKYARSAVFVNRRTAQSPRAPTIPASTTRKSENFNSNPWTGCLLLHARIAGEPGQERGISFWRVVSYEPRMHRLSLSLSLSLQSSARFITAKTINVDVRKVRNCRLKQTIWQRSSTSCNEEQSLRRINSSTRSNCRDVWNGGRYTRKTQTKNGERGRERETGTVSAGFNVRRSVGAWKGLS